MLRIPEYKIQLDVSQAYGLAAAGAAYLVGPVSGEIALVITQADEAADPTGMMAQIYQVMEEGAPDMIVNHCVWIEQETELGPFFGIMRHPYSGRTYMLATHNQVGIPDEELRERLGWLASMITHLSPVMETWYHELQGLRLLAADTYQRDYGSGDGYTIDETYWFRPDGMYEYTRQSHISVSSLTGDLGTNRTHTGQETGIWDIVEQEGQPHLRLEDAGGGQLVWSLRRQGDTYWLENRPFTRHT